MPSVVTESSSAPRPTAQITGNTVWGGARGTGEQGNSTWGSSRQVTRVDPFYKVTHPGLCESQCRDKMR